MAAPGLEWAEDRYNILTDVSTCYTNVEVVAYMMEARMDVFRAMAYYFIFVVIVFVVNYRHHRRSVIFSAQAPEGTFMSN